MNAHAWMIAAVALCAVGGLAHAGDGDGWKEIDLGGGKSFLTAPASARIESGPSDGYTSTMSVRTDDWVAVFHFVDHPVRSLDKFKRDAGVRPSQVLVSETFAGGWLLISRGKRGTFHADLAHSSPFYYCRSGTVLRTRAQADAVARVCKSLRFAPEAEKTPAAAGWLLCERIVARKGLPRGIQYQRMNDLGEITPASRRQIGKYLARIRSCEPSRVTDAVKLAHGRGWYFEPTDGLEDDAVAFVSSGKWVLKFHFARAKLTWQLRRVVLWVADQR